MIDDPGDAPFMYDDSGPHDDADQHWCKRVGSTIYAPRDRCPYCRDRDDGGEDR